MAELTVGVRELRNNLSQYLQRVKAGEAITITEYGQEVGRIVPPEVNLEERLRNLTAAKIVAWNGEKLEPYLPEALNRSETLASDIVVEMRA